MAISHHPTTWPFDVVNVDQAAAWDGEEGDHWSEHADRYDAAGRRYDAGLIDAAQITEDSEVLDVGCGSGVSTRDAARVAKSGRVLGVDLSVRLLEEARRRSRAESLTNTTFVQADAQVYRFEEQAFDVAISRFGAMFFGDPVAAFANLGRALRPDGRLALSSWRELAKNEWVFALREALAVGRTLPEPPPGAPGPFGLAEERAVRSILAEAGFDGIGLTEVNEPMYLGSDAEDAFGFVANLGVTKGMLDGLDDRARVQALANLRDTLAAHATPDGVLLAASGWLITARRR